jgi:hypothetical protein
LVGTEVAQLNELGVINLHKKTADINFEFKYRIAFDQEVEAFDYSENFQKATSRQKKEYIAAVEADKRAANRKDADQTAKADSAKKADEAAKEAARQAQIEAERAELAKAKAEADALAAAKAQADLEARKAAG